MKTLDFGGEGILDRKVKYKVLEGTGVLIDAGTSGKLAVNFEYIKLLLDDLKGIAEVYGYERY